MVEKELTSYYFSEIRMKCNFCNLEYYCKYEEVYGRNKILFIIFFILEVRMTYYVWIFINGLLIIGSTIYIWMVQPNDSTVILFGKLFAQVAILLFFINVNMYFIFLVIRKSKVRRIKITLSKISRKMMKTHIPIALAGTSVIVLHAWIMLFQLGETIGFYHPKMITGYFGIVMLSLTLYAGVLRHKKSSGFRRKFHLTTAMIFAGVFVIHLFLPL
jgi:hypothetical protein